jgi:hypothetical protein
MRGIFSAFSHFLAIRCPRALLVPVMLAGSLTCLGTATASAATCVTWSGTPAVSPHASGNFLVATTVLSPCDAWAVGFDQDNGGLDQTLIEHWDGTAWTVVPSPDVAGRNTELDAVRAESATDVWAVGESFVTGSDRALILHWDGHVWAKVANPNPGGDAYLNAVRAVSATDACAVGAYVTGGEFQPL